MMNNKVSADEQVQRMKDLMKYGINENKQTSAYSSVEYGKVAADGKLYGIVREGSKYYIKVGKDAKSGLVCENFDYIGGFRNRKDNMFESFASAQRFFCEKLMCINEGVDNAQKRVIAESWDLDEKKEVIEEGTRQMKAEIDRQRQIMRNAQNISEGKECDMKDCPKCDTIDTEEPKDGPGAPYTYKLTNKDMQRDNIKKGVEPKVGNKKATNESTEVPLSSRKDPDYMDETHGTKIGNNAPFVDPIEDKPEDAVADAPGGEAEKEPELEKVNEEVVMHDSQNQNSPEVGVNDKGDNAPYEKKADITEDIDDIDVELEDGEEGLDDAEVDVEDVEDDDLGTLDSDEAEEIEDVPVEDSPAEEEGLEDVASEDVEENDVNARMDSLEAKLDAILDAINNMKYDDDDELYDDEGGEEEAEDNEDIEVVESKSYKAWKKRMMNEEQDFGKHPAFHKKVMTYPNPNLAPEDGDYDMNDDSVENEKPYATSKGDNAPYEMPVDAIENAITEEIMRYLKKK